MRLIIVSMILGWSAASALSQGASVEHIQSEVAPYCSGLKQVVALGLSRDRFAPIAGQPREGNFRATSHALAGWTDCSLYGAGAYTCDSPPLESAAQAQAAQQTVMREVLACLGTAWAEIKDRSSPGYVVLHPLRGAISITLSLDETNNTQHVVRLTLFIRR